MHYRNLIPVLAVAALAQSAAAVTVNASTMTQFTFTLPANVSLTASASPNLLDATGAGTGLAVASIATPGNGVDQFGISTSAFADSGAAGIGSATSTGAYTFLLTNANTTKVTVNLHFVYDQAVSVTGTPGPNDYAFSSISSNGYFTGGNSDLLADFSHLTGSAGEAIDFSIDLNPLATRSFGFVNTSEVYASSVPEPASMAALGLGALGLLKRRKRA